MELWDIITADGSPTGRTMVRGANTLKSGEYHLVVHIWPLNDYGSILIQKRTKTKKLMPGIWAATGGAAIAGETSKQAASRELFEELGIKAQEGELNLVKRIKKHNSLLDVWTIKTNCRAPELKLQKSEVATAKWVSFDTLNAMVKNKEFHNYGDEYFELVKSLSDDIKAKRRALNSNL